MAQAQDHIHLDTVLGGAPENSPVLKFAALALTPETRSYIPFVAVEFAVNGTIMVHRVTEGGMTLKYLTRPVTVRLNRTDVEDLLELLGEYVYFVPSYHPDDGSDHTDYRVQVYFVGPLNIDSAEKKDLENFTAIINLQYVPS